ncbi:MAG: aminotransferase class I/II-fold pyridoxal phosphate-dependent enzyme, partial [Bacteroidota bacterium]
QGIDIFTGKEKGHVYARYGNPGIEAVAQKIANLEAFGTDLNTWGMLTSSGMSAISTLLLGLAEQGDKILTQKDLYGGTSELFIKSFGKMGIEPIFIDLNADDEIEAQLEAHPEIKFIYLETPANPTLTCIDIERIAALAKSKNIISIIDNTFATPYLQQPLKYGIDFVIHSTTKYINGHGNSIAGVIIGSGEAHYKKVWTAMKLVGTNCNAWDAWLTNNGLKTLTLRMDKHSSNALAVAQYLEKHKKVNKVNYPGLESHASHLIAKKQMSQFGGMLSFELAGGMEAGLHFMNSIEFCTLAPTLGDVDTLVLHPATSSHLNVDKQVRESAGITDGLIRLSVGIENVEDIISDLEKAI